MSSELPLARSLYLADLAAKLGDFESGRVPMNPTAYRLFARRLSQALAGLPEPTLLRQHGASAAVAEALQTRYFAVHGCLGRGAGAAAVQAEAALLFARLLPNDDGE